MGPDKTRLILKFKCKPETLSSASSLCPKFWFFILSFLPEATLSSGFKTATSSLLFYAWKSRLDCLLMKTRFNSGSQAAIKLPRITKPRKMQRAVFSDLISIAFWSGFWHVTHVTRGICHVWMRHVTCLLCAYASIWQHKCNIEIMIWPRHTCPYHILITHRTRCVFIMVSRWEGTSACACVRVLML